MKLQRKNIVETLLALLLGLYLAACGGDTEGRGSLGYLQYGGTNLQNSLTGFYCTATPSKGLVASGEAFQVAVEVFGSSGTVTLPGLNASGSGTSFVVQTSYNNTTGDDIWWQPTLVVRDSTNATARCSFQVYVRSNGLRRL